MTMTKNGSTKEKHWPNKILFAMGREDNHLVPLYAHGKFAEYLVYECGSEISDWSDMVPYGELGQPGHGVGLWVWQFVPTGGGYDSYNGDYDDPYIDKGEWRALEPREWHFVQIGESPWPRTWNEEELLETADSQWNFNLRLSDG